MPYVIPASLTVNAGPRNLSDTGVFVTEAPDNEGLGVIQYVAQKITLVNQNAAPQTVSLWRDATFPFADEFLIADEVEIAAGETLELDEDHVFVGTERLIGRASVDGAIVAQVFGVKRYETGSIVREVTPATLFHGMLAAAADGEGACLLYEAPDEFTTAVIHGICLVNTDSGPHDAALYIASDPYAFDVSIAVAVRLAIPAGERRYIKGPFTVPPLALAEPGRLSGVADTAGVVACFVDAGVHVVTP